MSEDEYSRFDDGKLVSYFHKNYPETTRYQLKDLNFALWNEFKKRRLMLVLPIKIEPALDTRVLALRPRMRAPEPEQIEELDDIIPQNKNMGVVPGLTEFTSGSNRDYFLIYANLHNGVSKTELAQIDHELFALMKSDGSLKGVPDSPYNGNPLKFANEHYTTLIELKIKNKRLWKLLYDTNCLSKFKKPVSARMAAS